MAAILAIIFAAINGGQDRCLDTKQSTLTTGLVGGIVGHYACCNGDTWSSELGMLSNSQPRLITTFKVKIFMCLEMSFHVPWITSLTLH